MWKIEGSGIYRFGERKNCFEIKNRINLDGILQLTVSESRTQLQNKKITIEKDSGIGE